MLKELFLGLVKNIFNLLFNPSAWNETLIQLDIPDDLTLLRITWHDLKNHRGIRFLCIQTLFIIPLLAGVFSIIIVVIDQGFSSIPALLFTFLLASGYAFTNALTTSLLIGFGAAQVYALSIGIGMGALGSDPTNIYFSYAIPVSLVARMLLNFSAPHKKLSVLKQNVFSFFSGILIVVITIVELAFIFSGSVVKGGFTRFAENEISLSDYSLLIFTSVMVIGVIVLIAILIRSSEWQILFRRKIFWAIGMGVVCGVPTVLLITHPPMTPLGAFFAGMGGGTTFAILFSLPWVVFNRTKLDSTVIIASTLMVGLGWVSIGGFLVPNFVINPFMVFKSAIFVFLVLTSFVWFPILSYPFFSLHNLFIYVVDIRDPYLRFRFFRFHSAFWYPAVRFPWIGLDHYLLKYYDREPEKVHKILLLLTQTHQRWAVRNVLFSVAHRELLACNRLEDIAKLSPSQIQLSDEFLTLNNQFLRLAGDVKTALAYQNPFHLRAGLARVRDELILVERSLMMSRNKRIFRFLAVTGQWLSIIDQSLNDLSNQRHLLNEIFNPYICGIPLNDKQEIFVGRTDIFERIEQLVLNEQRPPILLYGQRRMGKTSLLLNLGRILPNAIIPLYLDCQAFVGVRDFGELFYSLVQQMCFSANRHRDIVLPEINLPDLKESPFLVFMEWVIDLEIYLEHQGKITLWLLDEFETLDDWAKQRDLNIQELLNLMRHIVQHHSSIKMLFSGAHHLAEMEDWSSSLVNAHVIKLGCLLPNEAKQLIRYPVKNFNLVYPDFALDWIITLTGGHPHLIQLFCYELILLKNEQPIPQRYLITIQDLEEACRLATLSGEFFFIDIYKNQIQPNMQQCLVYLAQQTEKNPISYGQWKKAVGENLDFTIKLAGQRDIIKKINGDQYCFQIEWVRRWFAERNI